MNQAAHLYRLQKLDTQLDQTLARITEIERQLAEDEKLRLALQIFKDAQKQLELAQLNLRTADHLVQDQQVKIEQNESALYGGKIRNPKELQDLQKDIESLKRHLYHLEEQQLEAMIIVEDSEKNGQTAESHYNQTKADVIQAKAGLVGERDQLVKNQHRLETERSAALTPILETNLILYNRIREQRKGIAVASLEDGTCSTCGAPIRLGEAQSARLQSALSYCSSCGRILFAG